MRTIALQCGRLVRMLEDKAEFVSPLILLRVAQKIVELRAYITAAGWDPDRMGLGVIASTEGRGDIHNAHQHQAILTGHLVRYANRSQAYTLGYSGGRACTREQLAQELAEFEPLFVLSAGENALDATRFIGPPVPPPPPAVEPCPLFEEATT